MERLTPEIVPPRRKRWVVPVAIGLIALGAFGLRVVFQYHEVFASDGVVFQSTDPWYHARLMEQFARHAPHIEEIDPYAICPGGRAVLVAPMLDVLTVGIATVVAGGRPGDPLLHHVAAWLPPLLASLTVVVVFLLVRALAGQSAGLVAAGLLAVMPGQFLRYSVLGYCDHHVLESFLTAAVFLFVLQAVRGAWLGWSIGAGLLLAAYLMTWVAGGFVVLLLTTGAAADIVRTHFAGDARSPMGRIVPVILAIAALALSPFRYLGGWVTTHLTVLMAGALAVTVLAAGAAMARRTLRPRLSFAVGLIACGVLGGVGATLLRPAGIHGFTQMIYWSVVAAREALVEEATPLFMRAGVLSLRGPWETFGLTVVVALGGAAVLARRLTRRDETAATVVLLWSLGTLAATLLQERFAYYAAVNVAILAAVALHATFTAFARRPSLAWASGGAVLAGLIAVQIPLALGIARAPSGPSPDWREALRWLQANSPPPFGSEDHYSANYASPPRPDAGYGVMCSWDRGYWVTALAHRPPNANPSQANAADTSLYLVTGDEAEAGRILDRLRSRYVVLDCTVPVWAGPAGTLSVGKFINLATWAGRDPKAYFEQIPSQPEEHAPAALVYFPAYYQSMAVRLMVFGGSAYTPQGPATLMRFGRFNDGRIRGRRFIAASRQFDTYADAAEFQRAHAAEGWELVGLSPVESCVPLAALKRHKLIHQSPTTVAQRGDQRIAYVQIFEVPADQAGSR